MCGVCGVVASKQPSAKEVHVRTGGGLFGYVVLPCCSEVWPFTGNRSKLRLAEMAATALAALSLNGLAATERGEQRAVLRHRLKVFERQVVDAGEPSSGIEACIVGGGVVCM